MKLLTKQEELLMLALFSLRENAYLVNIREHIIETAGKDWAFGSIYMSLEKLRKNGYVKTRMGEPSSSRGGKAIKFYELTERGIAVLAETKKLHDRMWKEFSKFGLIR